MNKLVNIISTQSIKEIIINKTQVLIRLFDSQFEIHINDLVPIIIQLGANKTRTGVKASNIFDLCKTASIALKLEEIKKQIKL